MVAKINPDLMILAKPLSSLRNDERNARKHAKRDLDVLAKSLDEHGQQKPIVVLADGKVIAGNGTLEAARGLGWTHLACVTFDSEDAARAAAFAIVDNRSAELSEWDYEILALELKDLPPELLNEVGFAPYELDPLVRSSWTPPAPTDGFEQPEPSVLGERADTIFLRFNNPERFRAAKAALDARTDQTGETSADVVWRLLCS